MKRKPTLDGSDTKNVRTKRGRNEKKVRVLGLASAWQHYRR